MLNRRQREIFTVSFRSYLVDSLQEKQTVLEDFLRQREIRRESWTETEGKDNWRSSTECSNKW